MRDYLLEPPEEPEPPECCGDETICFPDGICLCPTCGLRFVPFYDPEEFHVPLEDHGDLYDGCRNCGRPAEGCVYCNDCAATLRCVHGNPPDACGACDFLADQAYDISKERR